MSPERPPAFFVGGHPAIDFLNTIATPKGVPVNWLTNGRDLVDWMEEANMIAADVAAKFRATRQHRELDAVAESAGTFRDWLRKFVTRHMGKDLTSRVAQSLSPLNELLVDDTSHLVVQGDNGGPPLSLLRVRPWASPTELLQPIAEAAADLICSEDFRLIRGCEGSACTLLFLDRTKAHARRWCSMSVCGNRAKVAAHRAKRKRT